jgi:hypothetical protein
MEKQETKLDGPWPARPARGRALIGPVAAGWKIGLALKDGYHYLEADLPERKHQPVQHPSDQHVHRQREISTWCTKVYPLFLQTLYIYV